MGEHIPTLVDRWGSAVDDGHPAPAASLEARHAPAVKPDDARGARRRRPRARVLRVMAIMALLIAAGGLAGWIACRAAIPSQTVATTGGRPPSPEKGVTHDVAGAVFVVELSIVAIHTRVGYEDGLVTRSRDEAGTGIVLSSDGLIVTNAHVIEDALSITISVLGHDEAHEAEVVAIDTSTDVAVIRAEAAEGLVPATFGDSDALAVGDHVLVMGNALDLGPTMSVTQGIVSALDRTVETADGTFSGLLQTDAAMSSGMSGGAVVDRSGFVVGMSSAAALEHEGSTVQNIGFAIPSNVMLEVVAGFELVAM